MVKKLSVFTLILSAVCIGCVELWPGAEDKFFKSVFGEFYKYFLTSLLVVFIISLAVTLNILRTHIGEDGRDEWHESGIGGQEGGGGH